MGAQMVPNGSVRMRIEDPIRFEAAFARTNFGSCDLLGLSEWEAGFTRATLLVPPPTKDWHLAQEQSRADILSR